MSCSIAILKTPPPLPVMPPALAQKCATFDGMDLVRGIVPAAVIEEAQRHLGALERYNAPASEGIIEAWCRLLRAGCAAIDERDFSPRLFAIREACEELPGWVWNREAMKRAWRDPRFRFFPVASDVFELLNGLAQKRLRGTAHVRLLANAMPAEKAQTWRRG